MIEFRPSHERGVADYGWLKSRHSFSFGNYYNPNRINWGPLRVINEDEVAPGAGFPTHPHRDMEIFSYVTKGALAHEDSLGNRESLTPGRIQLMSAGTGIQHSEFNGSDTESTHFLQIWIQPDQMGLNPSYQDVTLDEASFLNHWKTIIAPKAGRDQEMALKIHQNASVQVVKLDPGKTIQVPSVTKRKGYLHVIHGNLSSGQYHLEKGDALAIDDETPFTITAQNPSEAIFFDLPT